MTVPIVICDDSNLARKQMARALPEDWNVEITFATNGEEGVEALRAGKGDILFLDLTMPVMDGFDVLRAIRQEDLPTLVIVVSGDIQPDARQKVMDLGALGFIKKPINADELFEVLSSYGLLAELDGSGAQAGATAEPQAKPSAGTQAAEQIDVSLYDWYQELANVAMGQAADMLAHLLPVFITLSVPKVNLLEASDLAMTLNSAVEQSDTSLVSQGFAGTGVSGEVLLMMHDLDLPAVARLMRVEQRQEDWIEAELVSDIANILNGAFVSSLGRQLDLPFSIGHPLTLHGDATSHNFRTDLGGMAEVMAIELEYSIAELDIHWNQLILFTNDSLQTLMQRVGISLD